MSNPPIIVAHRGASHDAPENTQGAFFLAWMQGADAIEGDFHLTNDGQIVCIHDDTTDRTTNRKMVVAQSTFDTLRDLDAGGWMGSQWRGQRVLSLQEVLSMVPEGKQLFIEIKSGTSILKPLKAVLDESADYPERVILQTFESTVLRAAREMFSEYRLLKLVNRKRASTRSAWSPASRSVISEIRELGLDGVNCSASSILHDQDFAAAVRAAGKSLHAWTVNRPGNAATLAKLGVSSITTDRPGWLKRSMLELLAGE